MGRFDILRGKGKDITLGDEIFTIKPLSAEYLELLGIGGDDDNRIENLYELVLVSLRDTDKTITKEDVKSLPLGVFENIVKTINEVNEIQ